jgi:hypothetical protein
MINDMTDYYGHLCNNIIKAFAASFIAKQQNLEFDYGQYFDKMVLLGINLYTEGTMTYNDTIIISDSNIMMYLTDNKPIYKNIIVNHYQFKIKDFSNYLYNYYKDTTNQESIIDVNIYNNRYENNNDIFIHLKLRDIKYLNQGFAYYDKAIAKITSFENRYISSDYIDHDITKKLIKKYKLKIIDDNEIRTIMFGSTCKNIILTGGSFSYIIGLFGFFSKVYYPKGLNNWYPSEIFFIYDWNELN